MTTTLLKNARIIDGTGGTAYKGHVLIEGERITDVLGPGGAELPQVDATVDVTGRCLAPGFIDVHSHTDWQLPEDRHAELLHHLPEQGVTTVVAGNCGISAAPVRPETLGRLEKLASIIIDRPLDYGWRGFGELMDQLDRTGPVVNVAELVGHASVRYAETDSRRGPLSTEELRRCEDAVRRALDEGACGLSFGLGYDPGMYSPPEELEAFAAVAARAGKPITVHKKALSWLSPCYPVTTPRAHNILALEETLDLARRTGARLQLSHLIFGGRRSWRTAARCLELVADARRQGVDVMFDTYPYTCGNTTVDVLLPYWFLAKLPGAFHSRVDRLALRAELELGFLLVGFTYRDIQLMDVAVEGWQWCNGLRLTEIARRWHCSGFDALLRISEKSRGAALVLYHAFSGEPGDEGPLEAVLSDPACLFESDAVHRRRGYPNPAGLGTFPRILGEYSRRRGLFSLEDAIHRMTGASADRFGIIDRGRIQAGQAADLVIFHAERVDDAVSLGAAMDSPPRGIEQVFINGAQAVRDGRYLGGERVGQVLRV